jgi:TRAP-type mannitol/chloroaromatic compound transport system permease large subunit
VAGQSVVKLYAAAMFPGFFLAFLYLIYIVGWALINPKIAPRLPEEQTRIPVPEWMQRLQDMYSRNALVAFFSALLSPSKVATLESDGRRVSYWMLLTHFGYLLVPLTLVAGTLALIWW